MSEVQPRREGGNPGVRRPFLRRVVIGLCGVAFATVPLAGQSIVLDAMKAELDRSLKLLGEQEVPPYFLSYEITESHSVSVSGAFGALTDSSENRGRLLDIDLRVGHYEFDNTRPIRDRFPSLSFLRDGRTQMPVDNDEAPIRSILWSETPARTA